MFRRQGARGASGVAVLTIFGTFHLDPRGVPVSFMWYLGQTSQVVPNSNEHTISALPLHCGHSALYQAHTGTSKTCLPTFLALNPPPGLKFTSTFPRVLLLASTPLRHACPNRWLSIIKGSRPHALLKYLAPRCSCAPATAVSAHRTPHRLHPNPCASIRLIDGARWLCGSATAVAVPPAPDRLPPRPWPPSALSTTPSCRMTSHPHAPEVSRRALALRIRYDCFCIPRPGPLAPAPLASIHLIDGTPLSYDARAGFAHSLRLFLSAPPRTACTGALALYLPYRLHLVVIYLRIHTPLKYLGPRWLYASATVGSAPPAPDRLHSHPCPPSTSSTAPHRHITSPPRVPPIFRPPLPSHIRHGRFWPPPASDHLRPRPRPSI
ncbi:hypothetical protein C8F04DRAFT_1338204 [Mycena alexandri]|uniref:Uncharacterized protein n=1 Tax=Mycena alexandri TaxID=1745969 RepID=A0AAD6T310_9AGAR|nr:hypothetical protein C8F04DRAFT_1338204 [Mycena alexandri]